MNKEQIKDLILFILGRVDYDIAKQYDPETAEEPEYAEPALNALVKSVEKYLKSIKVK
jgi:hypothetical protein